MTAAVNAIMEFPGSLSPPASVEAEKAVLGAIFINNRILAQVGYLKPEHFVLKVHADVWEAINRLAGEGRVANPVTLQTVLGSALNDIGGNAYLADLASSAVGSINAVEYARIILDLAQRRQLIAMAGEINHKAHSEQAEKISEMAEGVLLTLADDRPRARTDGTKKMLELVENAIKNGGMTGISSGFGAMDEMLGGLAPGECLVIAARPSMGKTALATAIALKAAERDQPALFFSLEMVEEQIRLRLTSMRMGVPLTDLRQGRVDFPAMAQEAEKIARLPLTIDAMQYPTAMRLRLRAKAHKQRHGLKLVVVDHLRFIKPEDPKANRVHSMGDSMYQMKAMAAELDVPVLVLCQLNRGLESREDKRPGLGDLRDSGEIEENADAVMFLYRKAYHLEREVLAKRGNESPEAYANRQADQAEELAGCRERAEIIVAKQRQGATGSFHLRFEPHYTRFSEEKP